MVSTTSQPVVLDDHSLGHLLYALMSAFPLLLLPPLFALMISLGQKGDKMSSLLYSHIRWQRWSIISLFSLLLLAYLVPQGWMAVSLSLLALLWFCHRTIKGWMNLVDGLAI
ncbi:hypothetical protein SHLO109777_14265 [Shewanella loihica]|uniref:Transmembrane protein n=1 Tax=Shewanella loihica (strain ATCC BAA-1088 / PV-4) TaxID=323850 RepID=A3QBU4_SHELP|nr:MULTISPECIES: hypothetical protein [Shewanella]ABO22942.1 conserved hypothetical protein [Shewanella loihica PV-4]QYK13957.1 hypothetical protein K0I63_05420 [Shewanella rhizosphaerae]